MEHVGNVLHVVQPITRPLPENLLMNGQPKPGFYIVVALVVLPRGWSLLTRYVEVAIGP